MIQAVFIDVDNTLLDFDAYVYHTMETGFDHFNLKKFEPWMYDTFHTENNKLWRQIEDGTLVFSELEKIRWNKIFDALGIEFDGPTFEKYFRGALWDSAIPVDGAMELLERLSKKYVLCVASNGPYEQQLHRLEIAGMLPYFKHVFISEDLGASKPSKEFFEEAFRRINAGDSGKSNIDSEEGKPLEKIIAPQNAMIIGDSLTSDMAGGRGFGMQTYFFSRGKELPEGTQVDFWSKSLNDIQI